MQAVLVVRTYFLPTTATADGIRDWAGFNVSTNTVLVIRATVFTGQKTQPTVSKYWRNT